MKKNPYNRVDNAKMTDVEKIEKGLKGKAFVINCIEISVSLYRK